MLNRNYCQRNDDDIVVSFILFSGLINVFTKKIRTNLTHMIYLCDSWRDSGIRILPRTVPTEKIMSTQLGAVYSPGTVAVFASNGTAETIHREAAKWLRERFPESYYAPLINRYFVERPMASLICRLTPLLAPVFGVTDKEKIARAGILQTAFDCWTHILDDVTDEPQRANPATLHLSHRLLTYCFETASELMHNSAPIKAYWDTAMTAELQLHHDHTGLMRPYTPTDLPRIGDRGRLACVAATIFADITGAPSTLAKVEAVIHWAATAIQLIDDLFDCREDAKHQIYTVPLTLLCQQRGCSSLAGIDPDELERLLISSGAATDTVEMAGGYLTTALGAAAQLPADAWRQELQTINQRLMLLRNKLTNAQCPALNQLKETLLAH